MEGNIRNVLIEFDKNGSLATTHKSQGSDMGLFGGLMGWDATDERMGESEAYILESGIHIDIRIVENQAEHPNTYTLTVNNEKEEFNLRAISTGGGSIEIVNINEFKLSIKGDIYTSLFFSEQKLGELEKYINELIQPDNYILHDSGNNYIYEIRTTEALNIDIIKNLHLNFPDVVIKRLNPVFPVLSRKHLKVPFISCDEMLKYNEDHKMALWELAVKYESERGNISEKEVLSKMREIVGILDNSVEQGISGTYYSDRILGYQSGKYKSFIENSILPGAESFNKIILYVTSLMEVKSSMGLIVAAPTAGSCGGLPGVVLAVADVLGFGVEEKTKAMLAAGMIGVFISYRSTFAAETCGCQAECGAGSGMAAAALVNILSGHLRQAVSAASMALQNTLGMICDPVANRVEVPCLGKNIMSATNALSCANMALAGFDEVIPLDEVIETMDSVGKSIPRELRCTGLGGLSVTSTSKSIQKKLDK